MDIFSDFFKTQLLGDLDHLQLARSDMAFDAAAKLLIAKWKPISKPLVDYFEKEWLIENLNWHEGFMHKTPSTNNAQEAFNKVIKDEHTLRERLDLSQFRILFLEMIMQWSVEYAQNLNSINCNQPTIDLKAWTAGYNFARSNVKITSSRSANKITYTVPLISVDDSVSTDINYTGWKSFNDFKKYAFAVAHTTYEHPVTSQNWIHGNCDCSDGFKKYLCEHMIGIALRLKLVTAPLEAKTIPIGQKRKRGRPAKSKGALVYQ